jgi:hypothetical protein
MAVAIYGHVSQIGGTHVLAIVGDIVFHPDLHPHLHGGTENPVHRGT